MDVSRGMAAGLAIAVLLLAAPTGPLHAGGDPPEGAAQASPLRAHGNEPGWRLEIAGRRLVLVIDYGATRREATLEPPVRRNGAAVHRSRDGAVTVTLDRRLCRDDATGMPHPLTATVDLPDRRLAGCGGAPGDLLAGVDWRMTEAGGEAAGLANPAAATFRFAFDEAASARAAGRAAGQAGCNRFSAAVELTGEGMRIGHAAATRMACEPKLMRLEVRIFKALGDAVRFDFDGAGELVLLAVDGRVVMRAKAN